MLSADKVMYEALKNSTGINTAVGGRIYHNGVPNGGAYPCISFSEISNIPGLSADDYEDVAKITMQISLLSEDGVFGSLSEDVETAMFAAGFVKQSYNDLRDGMVRIKSMRFSLFVKKEE